LLLYFPYGRVAWFTSAVLFLMYYLGLVFDAVLLALRREPALQWYQRWWLYIGYCVLVTSANVGLAQIYRSQLGEAFHLLSGSMEQTLLPGDFLLVDTLHYRLGPIERGDVVAFWSDVSIGNPDQHTVVAGQRVLVKRVVGIPGDSIELRDELLYRNGAPVEEPYAVFSPMPTLEHFPMELRDTAPFVVPDGEYFVMGDNRRNSLDSRMFGCVRQEDMVGKVAIVYWSREAARVAPIDPRVGMNLQPGPPRRIRWERFGQRFE
jgi:signal peptidase I